MTIEQIIQRLDLGPRLSQVQLRLVLSGEERAFIIAALRAGQEMRDAIREPNLGNAQYAAQAWDAETGDKP